MSDPLAARRSALKLLSLTLDEGEVLDEAALGDVRPEDRARALTLARTTLRHLGAVDALIGDYVERRPKGPPLHVLRLGVAELMALRGAPHGVVDACVRLAKRGRTAKASGMVNAVLRRAAETGADRWAALNTGERNTPKPLVKSLKRDWGGAAQAIVAAHMIEPPLDLTPKDGDAAGWAARLGGTATPTGSVRLTRPGKLSALEGFDDGAWWAQDAAAAIPARLAGDGNGRAALDICAAPGGKTMQLAAAGWRVTALDGSARRMARLEENLKRTGLAAETVVADAVNWPDERRFDLVLLDPPCTATGTIRRHPELPWLKRGDPDQVLAAQRQMLTSAFARVAPGGVLIYCVCSLWKAEGETQLARFLDGEPAAERIPVAAAEVSDPELIDKPGGLRTRPDMWPDIGGLDGFYAARVRRKS